jgi:predicted phosphodiesterase
VIVREECIKKENSPIKCLVSGHTHNALVELVKVENGVEKYYINSGTFRNVITSTPTMGNFGRLRSKARVLIFDQKERNPEYNRQTGWSFDFNARYGYGSILE